MKTKILELRQDGKSYSEICEILGCSRSTVSYHCGKGQKELALNRQRKRSTDLVILNKVENFQFRYDRKIKDKSEDFQRVRDSCGRLKNRNITFNWKDVIEKFGWETTCYLTGIKINLREPKTYEFDHIVSICKGGESTLNNLGICCRNANRAKHDMSVEELINLCKKILENNGYEVMPLNNVE